MTQVRICVNGAVRDMTAEEEAEFLAGADERQQPSEPTAEERLEALEQAMLAVLGTL